MGGEEKRMVSSLEKYEKSHSRPSRDFLSLLVFFVIFFHYYWTPSSFRRKEKCANCSQVPIIQYTEQCRAYGVVLYVPKGFKMYWKGLKLLLKCSVCLFKVLMFFLLSTSVSKLHCCSRNSYHQKESTCAKMHHKAKTTVYQTLHNDFVASSKTALFMGASKKAQHSDRDSHRWHEFGSGLSDSGVENWHMGSVYETFLKWIIHYFCNFTNTL